MSNHAKHDAAKGLGEVSDIVQYYQPSILSNCRELPGSEMAADRRGFGRLSPPTDSACQRGTRDIKRGSGAWREASVFKRLAKIG